jgi:tripartite-type tricarboxylate transporter receptor subunit TctC
MVNPAVPAANIEQFVQYLKGNPGKLSYGTGGVGNITQLGVALFLQAKGLQAIHVPYKGTAPAMTDLIGGQTQFMLDALSSGLPYIRDQRVRALAVTSQARVRLLPGVPTLAESVMPGFVAPTWHGMLVPAGTPQAIVQRLNAAANAAVGDAEIRNQFAPQGVELQASTPEQFAAYLRAEIARWASAVHAAGVEPE